jgi:ABC-type sugar transport system permease subunit
MFSVKRATVPRRRRPKPAKHLSLRKYEATVGFLFLLPWIVGFILFKAVPILAALGFSFTNFQMLHPETTRFIGLANFVTFFRDQNAGASLFGSLSYFILSVPIELLVAMALAAIFCSERLKGKRLLRTLFFMPSIIPAVAIFLVISALIDPRTGWINRLIITPLHLSSSLPLGNLFPIILSLWTIGPGFLIMLGAMQAIPKELYEAARVDGAGPINRFLTITVPMSSPAIFFSLVIDMISSFGGVALLDRGLSYSQSLSPMESYIAYQMFSRQDLGYSSALAWVMFIVVMVITILLFRSTRYWVFFPEEESVNEI